MKNYEEIRLLNILKDNLHLRGCMCWVVWNLASTGIITRNEGETLVDLIEMNPPEKLHGIEGAFYFPLGDIESRRRWCDDLISKLNN